MNYKKKIINLLVISLIFSFILIGIKAENLEPKISIYFCPSEICENMFIEIIRNAEEEILCALYDINYDYLKYFDESKAKTKKIIIEKDNIRQNHDIFIPDSNRNLMHHKFCIIDSNKVWFGTANPTLNGFLRNDNIYFISENIFVEDFSFEFNRLLGNKEMKKRKNSEIIFCRTQDCGNYLARKIESSNNTINFATFSFTDNSIATQLLIANQKGVEIKGIFEERTSQGIGSVYNLLKYQLEEKIILDKNPNTMHLKLFLMDNTTWIGSYNPTNNGRFFNDEFVFYTDNEIIFKQISEYFYNLFEKYNTT